MCTLILLESYSYQYKMGQLKMSETENIIIHNVIRRKNWEIEENLITSTRNNNIEYRHRRVYPSVDPVLLQKYIITNQVM